MLEEKGGGDCFKLKHAVVFYGVLVEYHPGSSEWAGWI